jgi:hypothetical protein
MVVLHWYSLVQLDLLRSFDRITTDCIRLVVENYTGSSIQASKSDLPLWRTNIICKIHCDAVVVSVICNFMANGRCNILFWSIYCTSTLLHGTVRRNTL